MKRSTKLIHRISKLLHYQKYYDLKKESFSFFLDNSDHQRISGWVCNQKTPNNTLSIDFFDNNKYIQTIKADIFRQDLLNAGIGNGKHGFNFEYPDFLKDDKMHEITLQVTKTKIKLYTNIIFLPQEINLRKFLSNLYIKGNGVEIGALHNPLWVSPKAKVKYVDRFDTPTLKKTYPELSTQKLVEVNIIDNGEHLKTIKNSSLDFIICNHMLEHCQNPLGTLRNHLLKVKPNGKLYYAIPNKIHTFDKNRKLTTFSHLKIDDQQGITTSRRQHFLEWINHVEKISDNKEVANRLQFLLNIDYSIHFHVWNLNSFLRFLVSAHKYLKNSFQIVHFVENDKEVIAILKKN
ncbi:MAG: methyltransferase domain-containing protein [Candidatus Shapirobacteria bacterium]|jgi:2-polyprenyl-3-methyl-5-hydroxy-6-metoxy-1,4-benzoquinol methylase